MISTIYQFLWYGWASQVALAVKNPPASADRLKRWGFNTWVRKILWRRAWQPTPVFLPGESHDREACWAIIYRVAKSRTWLKRHTTQAHMVQLFPPWLISIHWIRSGEEMLKVSCLELMAANSRSRKNNCDSKKNKPIFTQQPLTWIQFLGW